MNYFKQIIYEMKHQRMMTWVSVSGTALSIFLVMAFFITDNLGMVDMDPENDRDRILCGEGMHVKEQGDVYDSSGMGLGGETAERLYDGLKGIELVSYIRYGTQTEQMSRQGQEPFMARGRKVDHSFWKMFDFRFIDGQPFDSAQVASGESLVVISRQAARRLFGEDNVSGRMIEIRMLPYRVVGVIDNTNPLATYANVDYYTTFNLSKEKENKDGQYFGFGNTEVILRMSPDTKTEDVKREVEQRYHRLQSDAKKEGKEVVYHNQPYDMAELKLDFGSNTTPDMAQHKKMQYLIYAIVLLLPAINLSSMTRSRLRHRVAEIGVRRAFGAKKTDIILQLLGENLLITCIGGLIGLLLCGLFLVLVSHLFFNYTGNFFETSLDVLNTTPDLTVLFRWENFLVAFGFCFVLNIISATVPAWRASRRNPAEAITGAR